MNALLSNPFKERLRKGEVQIGLWLSSTTAYMAEIAATSGYDWLLIDGEHAPNTIQDLYHQLQAVAPYASQPVIRPVEGSKPLIKQVPDIGAQTLLIPMVDTAEQARQVVSATRYPPTVSVVSGPVWHGLRAGDALRITWRKLTIRFVCWCRWKVKRHWITRTKSSTSKGLMACLLDLRIFLRRWATRITPGTRKCSELLKPVFGGSVLRVKRLVFWLWLLIWRSNAAWGANFVAVGVDTMLYSDAPINDWRCLNQAKWATHKGSY